MRPAALLLLLAACAVGHAAPVEEALRVPVRFTTLRGEPVEQPVEVLFYRDDARTGPAPLVVISHGRSPDAKARQALGRASYPKVVPFFLERGFVVAVPTRVGYGRTGGPDLEDSGPCDHRDFAPAYDAAARQVQAVVEHLRGRPDVRPDQTLLVGQSFGGVTTLSLAASNLAGVQAGINFAGGGGGNPRTRPGQPCGPDRMEAMLREYGRDARVPVLWVYAENDRYFGAELPRRWFAAYAEGGAPAEFQQYGPHGSDGHALFAHWPGVWHARVDAFLSRHGYAVPIPVPPLKAPR